MTTEVDDALDAVVQAQQERAEEVRGRLSRMVNAVADVQSPGPAKIESILAAAGHSLDGLFRRRPLAEAAHGVAAGH